jgi:hypothetical protein
MVLAAATLVAVPALAQLQLTPQVRQTPAGPPSQASPPHRQGESQQGQRRPPLQRQQQPEEQQAAAPTTNFPRRLDQRTIRTRFFNGQPMNARALGGALFTVTFFPDGRLQRTNAQSEVTNGRWRFQGDAYCSRWDGSRTETCHTVVEDGSVIKVVRNTRAVATWAREGTPPPP